MRKEKKLLKKKVKEEALEDLLRILQNAGKNEWTTGTDVQLIPVVLKEIKKLLH